MATFIFHYATKTGSLSFEIERGTDFFNAVGNFGKDRPIKSIVSVRRMSGTHEFMDLEGHVA